MVGMDFNGRYSIVLDGRIEYNKSYIDNTLINLFRPVVYTGNIDEETPFGFFGYALQYTSGILPTNYGFILNLDSGAWRMQLAISSEKSIHLRENINYTGWNSWERIG